MKHTLNRLINHELLNRNEAKEVLIAISRGGYNHSQIAAFLTIYMMRSITLDELAGFRDALLELCIRADLDAYDTIDLCGTGGDAKNTFNISTLASFVTAGAGIMVSKHGNYGVSSVSGSSNVLETLGIHFSNDSDHLKECLDSAGICILHAPLFHPAMKQVAPVRNELGVKTFFNMLGPLVNPAFPKHQLVGVFNLELARLYGYLYQRSTTNYAIVHSTDGYDEISLTGPTRIFGTTSEKILTPAHFGMPASDPKAIYGGKSVMESAMIFMRILQGEGSPEQENVVCANAGLAISIAGKVSLQTGVAMARESLRSGKALLSFKKLQELSSVSA